METLGLVITHQCSDAWLQSADFERGVTRLNALLSECGITSVAISGNCFSPGYIPDIYPHHGILSALHAGLFYRPECHLLCVAPDMPGLSTELLRWLLVSGRIAGRSCHYRHHGLPLYLHNSQALRECLEHRLTCGEPVNTDCLTILQPRQLVAPDPSCLLRTLS
ncbi:hypothetical protein GCM10009092_11310 [Bowmanella denitrificans]|uniref:MobA-like NTP transferase domain-containing protein n=1 Tax=Bowmanella denitrificans TaxID=366582 RepID=A0ABN0WWM3_9ALTE